MNFGRFKIVNPRNVQALEDTNEVMVINLDHVVSVKPISIPLEAGVAEGYWVRTSNGKKYRAIEVPEVIKDLIARK